MSERRKIYIDGNNFSIDADLIKNEIIIIERYKKKKIVYKNFQAIDTYKYQLTSLLNGDYKNLCNIEQAMKILKIISNIKKTKTYYSITSN